MQNSLRHRLERLEQRLQTPPSTAWAIISDELDDELLRDAVLGNPSPRLQELLDRHYERTGWTGAVVLIPRELSLEEWCVQYPPRAA